MCSGLAGESWGHLLPQRRRETGETEGVGLCGHSKGPRSSFNSRAAEPHSSARAPLGVGGRGLQIRAQNAENGKTCILACTRGVHEKGKPGGQEASGEWGWGHIYRVNPGNTVSEK